MNAPLAAEFRWAGEERGDEKNVERWHSGSIVVARPGGVKGVVTRAKAALPAGCRKRLAIAGGLMDYADGGGDCEDRLGLTNPRGIAMKDTDRTWEYFGRTDPYFGVLTQSAYKIGEITEAARKEFFETGRRYVEFALGVAHDYLDPSFRPTRALDFGCGVGRLAIPLARICQSVVGVDVSEPMLAEARRNSLELGAHNISFVSGNDSLSAISGDFDLVNSLIVFQHIPPPRGEAILKKILGRLRDGGIGILQFTYGFASDTPWARKARIRAYKTVPMLWGLRNLLKSRPLLEPMMQMNEYHPGRLLRILHESHCHLVHLRFTETDSFGSPFYGVILFFQKKHLDPRLHA